MKISFSDLKENFLEESDRWIAWIPVLFGLGIGLYFLWPTEPSRWLVLVVFETLLALTFFFRHRPTALSVLTMLLIVMFGFINIELQTFYHAQKVELQTKKEEIYLKGKIFQTDLSAKNRVRLWLKNVSDESRSRRGMYRISLRQTETDLTEGQCVEMIATLMPSPLPVMPETYQFGRKMFFEGISASGYVGSKVYPIDCEEPDRLSEKISRLILKTRKAIAKRIRTVLPADEAAVATTLMTGFRNEISPQTAENYRDSGLAHFLSISGLHMGMIAALAFFLLRFLCVLVPPLAARYNSKKAAAAFAMLISFMYLLISGAQIPTQRAFMMTFVVFLGILFDRRAVSMRMLAFAAFVVLLISPQALVGAGFQMSFAAVTVLIAFYERYASAIQRYLGGHSLIKIITAYIVGLLISDFVASTATLPFAIYHFNKIAVYTTLGNLLAGPIIGCVIMPFVLMALLLMPFGADFIPLKIVGWGVRWVNGVTEWVSSLPNAGFKVLSMPLWGLILIVFGGLWICLWQKRWRRLGLVPLLIGVCSLFFRSVPDALYSADAQDFACRDQDGRMVIVSEKTDSWTRRIWLEKTLGEMPNDTEKEHKSEDLSKEKQADQINLSCFQEECVCRHLIGWKKGTLRIGKEIRNTKSDGGGAVYLHNGKVKIKTVCAEVGSRPWNLCP